ncbi:MAG: hypothetical protein Q9P01_04620 [Anaerolineae bacterium]|nr:hypothetical protein [Anaerolineae bacterium]MDQ7034125.1 hypothetical protein [Anaerolineae bacterium]
MQETTYSGFVARAEWRWVFLVSVTLLLFTFTPFIIVAVLNPPGADWQFMGALHDYQDSAASMARIRQGAAGQFLTQFAHTPESQTGALVHPIYALLGQASRFSIQSPIMWFHLGRMVVSIFMYVAIYHLGASIWVKVNTRRIFFVIATIGSGFGWLYALLTGISNSVVVPDLMIPQISPFFSAGVNVHYPLTIACLAWLASVIVPIFRPGETLEPSVANEGLMVFLVSLLLAFVYPDALLPIGIAYVLSIGVHLGVQRKLSTREIRWGLWILVPALPLIAYYLLTFVNNAAVAEWIAQRGDRVPSLPMLLLSLGLPLLIALPALYRAGRRFEADGDRFMLLWLLSMIITMYLPLKLNQYFLAGLMLPVAYFATRAVVDFWFGYVKRRYRGWVYVTIVPLFLLSHILWLYLPIVPIVQGWSNVDANVLEQDYVDAFDYLDSEIRAGTIILASPDVSTWIPVWTDGRPVYGHYAETVDAQSSRQAVREWYTLSGDDCLPLLERYHVAYVILGPRENRIGSGQCVRNLILAASSDNVNVYAVSRNIPR